MKLKEIFEKNNLNIFEVINDNFKSELDWEIEETNFSIIPVKESVFYVSSSLISEMGEELCFLEVITPERIAENVIVKTNGKILFSSVYDLNAEILPNVGSECLGEYNLYYSKRNPEIGISILKNAFKIKQTIAIVEDLGYIYRDEKQYENAIAAFLESIKLGPSSEYIYLELSRLYNEINDFEKAKFYEYKFKKQ